MVCQCKCELLSIINNFGGRAILLYRLDTVLHPRVTRVHLTGQYDLAVTSFEVEHVFTTGAYVKVVFTSHC